MTGATHFIELFHSGKLFDPKLYRVPVKPIDELQESLKRTKGIGTLQTHFVWKIKLKPGVIIASHDSELNATIISHE